MRALLPLILSLAFAGFISARPDRRIVGGEEVDPIGAWPWQGALYFLGGFSCGAVLVSENYALTAAHCLGVVQNPADYTLVFGAHDRISENEGAPETYELEEFRLHPGFVNDGSLGFPNDLAGMKLATPASLNNSFIDFVALDPQNGTDRVGDECFITGWGRTCGGCALPDELRQADIGVISNDECSTRWNDITPTEVRESHICVFDDPDEEKGACNGDSGGPLVCRADADSDWELCGITSWGLSGCGTEAPSVYTRVSYFSDWLCIWSEGEVGCA